ncbi:type VI secretion system baseplate subunit TssK [Derxia gummosa]|uniref:Type VI secretion system baseplate subunit TssK n=1 Tax=Derxia gummosa DSM 723 TaxID=1121388 RepID=A0A8B6X2H9_9BURK|nr:type VI secretion system baseplate subunit TssK [Derxia gummosa]
MTWYNNVVWTEGMFLQPQHFQQQDRHGEHLLDLRLGAVVGYGWGFTVLKLDDTSLPLGKIAITEARGVLPDGTPFAIPADDGAPPALDIPADLRDEVIVLSAVLRRPGVAETDAEEAPHGAGPRYAVAEAEVGDSNLTAGRTAPLQIGRLQLRLRRASDVTEGFAALGVARVAERRADNRVVLDAHWLPPLLDARAHPLPEGWTREIAALLRQRGEALAARIAAPGRAGVGEIADFLLLQTVNRNEPVFMHLHQLTLLHPERLYVACLALAGDLATFRDQRRPPVFADYLHDDLARCFAPLIAELRQSLSMVLEQTAISIELQQRNYGVRVALIGDVELQRNAMFVLAVAAQMPGEALRQRFPTQTKIGPVERIRDLVNLALPGVPLRPLPVAPRQIPYHAGYDYFELETRGNDLWKQLEASGGLAMHVAGDFPGLELEFWAIRQ